MIDAATKAKLTKQFIEQMPFSKALGLRVDALDSGVAVLSMPYDEKLIGDPDRGVVHGGAVSALMDTCGGAAAISHPKAGVTSATINLRIDYMRGATPGARITARAECFHITRSVAFIRAVATDAGDDSPMAVATGTFTVVPAPDEPAATKTEAKDNA